MQDSALRHIKTRYVRLSGDVMSFAYNSGLEGEEPTFAPWEVRGRSSLTINLREACDREPLLALPTERTEVMIGTSVVAVPLDNFDEEQCVPLWRYVVPRRGGERVFYDTLPQADCVLLYGASEEVCRAFEDSFGEVHFTACLTHVLRNYMRYHISPAQSGCHGLIFLHENVADVAIFEGHSLTAVNTFVVNQPGDVAYYALNLSQSVGLKPLTDKLRLCGDDVPVRETLRTLRQFCPGVEVLESKGAMPYDMQCAVR